MFHTCHWFNGKYLVKFCDLTLHLAPKWCFSKGNLLFQGNLGGWNIIPFGQKVWIPGIFVVLAHWIHQDFRAVSSVQREGYLTYAATLEVTL